MDVKNIYITGSSGVLGFEAARHFSGLDQYKAIAVSRSKLPDLSVSHLEHRKCASVYDIEWFDPADSDATIVHCASLSDPRIEFDNYSQLMHQEILPHIEMLERLLDTGWKGRFIYISSGGAVYGDPLVLPISESHATNPKSYYGLQKATVEKALLHLSNKRGFELQILRVSNPYGSDVGKKGQGVIPILIDACRRGQEFTVFGDGSALRDYVHISDVCAAIESAASIKMDDNDLTLNIGSGVGWTVNQLIEKIQAGLGRTLKCTYIPSQQDVVHNVLCNEAAHKKLGWAPKVPFDIGLNLLLQSVHVDS